MRIKSIKMEKDDAISGTSIKSIKMEKDDAISGTLCL